MSFSFHPAAEAEFLESIAYYESKVSGLGAAYLAEIESVIERVCETPLQHPVALPPDIRCIQLVKFPFTIMYREVQGVVQVLAVSHQKRRPQYWLGRL